MCTQRHNRLLFSYRFLPESAAGQSLSARPFESGGRSDAGRTWRRSVRRWGWSSCCPRCSLSSARNRHRRRSPHESFGHRSSAAAGFLRASNRRASLWSQSPENDWTRAGHVPMTLWLQNKEKKRKWLLLLLQNGCIPGGLGKIKSVYLHESSQGKWREQYFNYNFFFCKMWNLRVKLLTTHLIFQTFAKLRFEQSHMYACVSTT